MGGFPGLKFCCDGHLRRIWGDVSLMHDTGACVAVAAAGAAAAAAAVAVVAGVVASAELGLVLAALLDRSLPLGVLRSLGMVHVFISGDRGLADVIVARGIGLVAAVMGGNMLPDAVVTNLVLADIAGGVRGTLVALTSVASQTKGRLLVPIAAPFA